ncbi:unnamed protein product [Vitrella brassicaformis CCMP3155]|uniref:Tyrosine-protein kinase ephrin type A/B receptor-like domain-containing protein n=2 Tax=Vitrella brassicaformis TaxID=1169539 RepID=A0A0G4FU29_VITBC|nr:unnamed protein product [Vitrella brassicaformis CCMP3155]|eukprot:CEM18091.1 unnamed protein product [Vitrella brassicaformis CCMP3155]
MNCPDKPTAEAKLTWWTLPSVDFRRNALTLGSLIGTPVFDAEGNRIKNPDCRDALDYSARERSKPVLVPNPSESNYCAPTSCSYECSTDKNCVPLGNFSCTTLCTTIHVVQVDWQSDSERLCRCLPGFEIRRDTNVEPPCEECPVCERCPPQKHSNYSVGTEKCILCGQGAQANSDQTECECKAGYFPNERDASKCNPCRKGEYGGGGSKQCEKCGEQFSSPENATSQEECYCNEKYIKRRPKDNQRSPTCEPCDVIPGLDCSSPVRHPADVKVDKGYYLYREGRESATHLAARHGEAEETSRSSLSLIHLRAADGIQNRRCLQKRRLHNRRDSNGLHRGCRRKEGVEHSGYRDGSFMCGVCDKGWTRSSASSPCTKCLPLAASASAEVLLIGFSIGMIFLTTYLSQRPTEGRPVHSMLVKIGFTHFTATSCLGVLAFSKSQDQLVKKTWSTIQGLFDTVDGGLPAARWGCVIEPTFHGMSGAFMSVSWIVQPLIWFFLVTLTALFGVLLTQRGIRRQEITKSDVVRATSAFLGGLGMYLIDWVFTDALGGVEVLPGEMWKLFFLGVALICLVLASVIFLAAVVAGVVEIAVKTVASECKKRLASTAHPRPDDKTASDLSPGATAERGSPAEEEEEEEEEASSSQDQSPVKAADDPLVFFGMFHRPRLRWSKIPVSWTSDSWKAFISDSIPLWIICLTFLHRTATKSLLQLLQCHYFNPHGLPYPSAYRWLPYPDYFCAEPRHLPWFVIGICGFLLWWIAPIIAAVIFLCQRRGRLSEPHMRSRYGFLYQGYRRRYFFWDSIFAVRRIAVIATAQLAIGHTEFQLRTWGVLALLFLILQLYCQPFDFRRLNILNRVESLGLATWMTSVLLVHFVFLGRDEQGLPEDGKGMWRSVLRMLVLSAVLIFNVLFFLWLLLLLIDNFIDELATSRKGPIAAFARKQKETRKLKEKLRFALSTEDSTLHIVKKPRSIGMPHPEQLRCLSFILAAQEETMEKVQLLQEQIPWDLTGLLLDAAFRWHQESALSRRCR